MAELSLGAAASRRRLCSYFCFSRITVAIVEFVGILRAWEMMDDIVCRGPYLDLLPGFDALLMLVLHWERGVLGAWIRDTVKCLMHVVVRTMTQHYHRFP